MKSPEPGQSTQRTAGLLLLERLVRFEIRCRGYLTLSGGERQRVHLARVLVQLALSYADRIALLRRGRIVECGAPGAVLTPAHVLATFDVAVTIVSDPRLAAPFIVPLAVKGTPRTDMPREKEHVR